MTNANVFDKLIDDADGTPESKVVGKIVLAALFQLFEDIHRIAAALEDIRLSSRYQVGLPLDSGLER